MSLRLVVLHVAALGLFLPSGGLASAQPAPDIARYADASKLLPKEREFIKCAAAFYPQLDRKMATLSYLHLRGGGLLADPNVVAKLTPEDKGNLLAGARNVVMGIEAGCAMGALPKPRIEREIPVNVLAKKIMDAGLDEAIVMDAQRYLTKEYRLASDHGVVGVQGDVVRALMARQARGGGDMDAVGNLRFGYYLCVGMLSKSECSPPLVLQVLKKYGNF